MVKNEAKLEEVQANKQLKQAKDKCALVEVTAVSHSKLTDELSNVYR